MERALVSRLPRSTLAAHGLRAGSPRGVGAAGCKVDGSSRKGLTRPTEHLTSGPRSVSPLLPGRGWRVTLTAGTLVPAGVTPLLHAPRPIPSWGFPPPPPPSTVGAADGVSATRVTGGGSHKGGASALLSSPSRGLLLLLCSELPFRHDTVTVTLLLKGHNGGHSRDAASKRRRQEGQHTEAELNTTTTRRVRAPASHE